MNPLPPEAVAGIDQSVADQDQRLDRVIDMYQKIAKAHGTAAATAVVASQFWNETKLPQLLGLVQLFAVAIARCADYREREQERDQTFPDR